MPSNFIYGSVVLANNKADGGAITTTAKVVASEWNTSVDALYDIKGAITDGEYYQLKDMVSAMPAVAASGKVRFVDVSGVLFVSANGGSYLPVARFGYQEGTPGSSALAERTFQAVDCTSGAQVLTLPTASLNSGRAVWVIKTDTSANTLTCGSTVLRSQFETAQFVCDGTSWIELGVLLTEGAQRIVGAKTFSSPITYAGTTSITAHAGGGQGSATALTAEINYVTTVATANDSVKLPTAALGASIKVFNQSLNLMAVYPATGAQIDALGTNAAYTISPGAEVEFGGKSATAWVSNSWQTYTVDVRRFGVVADGVTDDTAAIQAALDFGFDEVSALRPCVLQFPIGTMKVSSTLLWRGNSAAAPTILGAAPVGFDRVASTFAWYGADNGVVLFAQSANKGVIQNITIDGRDIGGILMHLSASTYADPAILAATSGIRVLRCGFSSCKPGVSGNGCIALGTDPALTGGDTYQQSEVVFRDCWFIGESAGAAGFSWAGLAAYGIKTLSNGNCKNFAVYDCTFNVCETAINWTAGSGDFVIANFNGGNCQKAVRQSDGHLIILGGDFECADVTDFCFLYGSGGGGDCCADIRSVEAFGYQAGTVGTMISWGGSLSLTNCSFGNQNHSVSGNLSIPNPFKMIGAGLASTPAGVTSTGCWFQGAVDYAPFYDGSGNWLAPVAGQYGGYTGLNVRSWGDKGGVNVNLTPVALGNFDSRPQTFFGTGHNGPFRLSYLTIATPIQFTAQNSAIAPIDATAGDQTLTLPTAVGVQGQVVFATKSDSSANTVTCNGVVLRSQYECALFVSNGASWDVLGVYLTTGAQRINGAKTFSSPIVYDGVGSITAHAGGGQGSATALTGEVNYVTTVASSGDSSKLPTAALGSRIVVFNQGANAMDLFPASGGQIDALGANAAYSLASGATKEFWGSSATQWFSK